MENSRMKCDTGPDIIQGKQKRFRHENLQAPDHINKRAEFGHLKED